MKTGKRIVCIGLAIVLSVSAVLPSIAGETAQMLTAEQKNAIAMLNYITVLTQDINKSKNSKVYMENAYSNLVNNIYPNSVDDRTLDQLQGLLDTMERYRMIDVKRERLQEVYEQSKALKLKSAIPNPLGLLSSVNSISLAGIVASGLYMAIDSKSNYSAFNSSKEKDFLEKGWALDDAADKELHERRKSAFTYMIKMVNEYGLPGDSALTEEAVDDFVSWKANKNVVARIQFLEENQETYKDYGGYWLTLADSYYDLEDYQKCLDAVTEYESISARIFRHDYDYAQILPRAITAAGKIYKKDQYISVADNWCQKIMKNTEDDDWSLRYFAAQTYLDLYGETKEQSFIEKAYKICLNNVNVLAAEQQKLNERYLNKPEKLKVFGKKKAKEEKAKEKEKKDYNKMLMTTRECELPPIYEPLQLNCDLLFAIAKEMGIPSEEKSRIDHILHPNDDNLFLTDIIDQKYWFDGANEKFDLSKTDISYEGNELKIPANLLTSNSSVNVTVKEKDGNTTELKDWEVQKVERKNKQDLSKFIACFNSKSAKDYRWKPGEKITITIKPDKNEDSPVTFNYRSDGTKDKWYDYAKIWEGHKNHWYDYARVWENSVEFVREA